MLLKREENFTKLFKRRILRIAYIIMIWSLIYKISIGIIRDHRIINLEEMIQVLKTAFQRPVTSYLWFLYALLGIYFMLPFLRKLVKHMSKAEYSYFLGLWLLVSSVLVTYNRTLTRYSYNIPAYIQMQLIGNHIGFYVLGYYWNYIQINKKKLKLSYLVLVTSIVLNTMITCYISLSDGKITRCLDDPLIVTVILESLAMYVILKNLGERLSKMVTNKEWMKRIIGYIAECTFGIYLVHQIVIVFLCNTSFYNSMFGGYNSHIYKTLVLDCFVFMISMMIVILIKQIPGLKKIV